MQVAFVVCGALADGECGPMKRKLFEDHWSTGMASTDRVGVPPQVAPVVGRVLAVRSIKRQAWHVISLPSGAELEAAEGLQDIASQLAGHSCLSQGTCC